VVKSGQGVGFGESSGSSSPSDYAADGCGAAATFVGDFAVLDRADEPGRTGADHSGLSAASAYAAARAIEVAQQNMTRCLERAAELGVIEMLDDRPRAGRDPVITAALACREAKELGYPTSCGPLGCSPHMPGNTDRPPGIRAWASWPKGQCAR
jgi:hypothetical protein